MSGFDAYKKAIALADVVILATPPGFRPIHFEEAINKTNTCSWKNQWPQIRLVFKKYWLLQKKPKQKKLNVVVGLQRRYQTSYRELMKRVQDGAIGDITSAQAWWNNDGVWVRPRKPDQTEMEYQMRNWYYFVWLCGDHITEQHIHNLDVINWVKNGYPVKCTGNGWKTSEKRKRIWRNIRSSLR